MRWGEVKTVLDPGSVTVLVSVADLVGRSCWSGESGSRHPIARKAAAAARDASVERNMEATSGLWRELRDDGIRARDERLAVRRSDLAGLHERFDLIHKGVEQIGCRGGVASVQSGRDGVELTR